MSATAESAEAAFVDAWASMAGLFSFSPSTARISGLLIGSGHALSPAEISERLGLSRGNVSMCLKELRGWGVVQRSSRPGDRCDYYESRGDLFEQTLAIARERKRREFDPVVHQALDALATLSEQADDPERAARLAAIGEYLRTVDRLGREVLDNPMASAAMIALLKSQFGAEGNDA
ncbi:MAG: MarR family transcriptional regulator [Myxococcota bacterium]